MQLVIAILDKNIANKQQKMVTISESEYEKLKSELKDAQLRVRLLEEAIKSSKQKMYAASSEKRNVEQLDLFFNEAEETATVSVETEETPVAAHTRKKKHMLIDKENLPKGLPVETVEHGLDEKERECSVCGTVMEPCGKYEKLELKIIPASFTVIRHVYYTYNCPKCKVRLFHE